MSYKRLWLMLLINILLTGCACRQKYELPLVETPCEWHSVSSEGMQSEYPDCFLWWQSLNDPTLNSLIERASSQNLDLSIAAMRILEVRAEERGLDAKNYPHFDATATCGRVRYDKGVLNHLLGTTLSKNHIDFFEYGFDADWEVDLFGVSVNEREALKARIASAEEDFSHILLTLIAEVARNYVELRGLQARLELITNAIDDQIETLQLTKDLSEKGFTTVIDEKQAEENLYNLIAQKPQLELLIDKTIHRLSILLAYNPGDLFLELQISCRPPSLPCEKPIGLPSELLRRRPDIRKAERDLAAAHEGVNIAIGELFPRFSLKGFIGEVGAFCTGGGFTWLAAPHLILPLFNSKLIQQDIYVNKIRKQQALYNYQKVVLNALEEAENAIASFRYELERKYSLEKALSNSQEAHKLSIELYQNGFKNFLDVLSAKRSLTTAKEAYAQSQTTLLLQYIALYKALGGGWEICQSSREDG